MKQIFCQKLRKKGKKMDVQPVPGEIGEEIFNKISQEGWKEWLNHQTILINEYRLKLANSRDQEFLLKEMRYFFDLH